LTVVMKLLLLTSSHSDESAESNVKVRQYNTKEKLTTVRTLII